ncbi:MAG: sugar phosphate isomerase/epimerase family protein [Geminicoccaceae bacterium]
MEHHLLAGFGFSTIGGEPDLSGLDDALSRIEQAGASHAELRLSDADILSGGRILPHRRRMLERICSRHRLQYTIHGALGANFMDEDHRELHLQVARSMLELGGDVGASVMVHHPGFVDRQDDEAIARLEALEDEALLTLADQAAELGMRVAVETLFTESHAFYTPDPWHLAMRIASLDHPNLCGTLDFSHCYIMATLLGRDLEDAVRAFAPVAGHIHVHDSFGRPNTLARHFSESERIAFGMGDLHLPPGWGNIDWHELFANLSCRSGSVMILEIGERHWGALDDIAAGAQTYLELANKSAVASSAAA